MLEWQSANKALSVLFHGAQTLGSDTSTVNLYLLCDKYNTEVALADGVRFPDCGSRLRRRKGAGAFAA